MGIKKDRFLFQYNLFEEISLDNQKMISPVMDFIVTGLNSNLQAQKVNIYHSALVKLYWAPWRTWVFVDKREGSQKGNIYTLEQIVKDVGFLKKAIRKSMRIGPEKIIQIKDKKLQAVKLEDVLYQEISNYMFQKPLEKLSKEERIRLNRHVGQKYDKSRLQKGYLIDEPIMKKEIRALNRSSPFILIN